MSAKKKTTIPSQETIAALEGLRREVLSGMVVLRLKSDDDKTWNASREGILALIEKYKKGTGLFQY